MYMQKIVPPEFRHTAHHNLINTHDHAKTFPSKIEQHAMNERQWRTLGTNDGRRYNYRGYPLASRYTLCAI